MDRTQVRLFPSSSNEQLIEDLRQDLVEVGPTDFVQEGAAPNAKGAGAPEIIGLAVTLLSTPAILRLIDLMKEYLMRDKGIEFEWEDNGRKVRLKSSDLSAEKLQELGETLIEASKN